MVFLSRLVFGFAGGVLMLLAIGLIIFGCYRLLAFFVTGEGSLEDPLLGAVGYAIIAIAVFDVAKFIIEEEVLNGRERRIASEARRSLTKFISTIAIAVFFEGSPELGESATGGGVAAPLAAELMEMWLEGSP